jgi:hypothetical protein
MNRVTTSQRQTTWPERRCARKRIAPPSAFVERVASEFAGVAGRRFAARHR